MAFSSIVALSGCCSDAGCDTTVVVEFTSGLPVGEYRLELVGTKLPVACTFEIDGEGSVTTHDDCVIDGNEDGGFHIAASELLVYEDPKNLEVTIAAIEPNIEVAASETYELTYETTYPNGKSCGPECINAAEQSLDTSALVEAVEAATADGFGGAGGGGGASGSN